MTVTTLVWTTGVRLSSVSLTHLPPGQNGRHLADDIFKYNNPALDLIMAWRRRGDTSLFEPMLTHIFGTRARWVKLSATNNTSTALAIVILTAHNCHTTPSWEYRCITQIARFTWPPWSPPGADRWAPCWPHEPCYQGSLYQMYKHIHMYNVIQFIQYVAINGYLQEHAIISKLNLAIHFPLLHISCRA